MIDPIPQHIINPPAIVVESEQAVYQRLVMQGREAAALEAEGKNANVAWLQALKKAYPDVRAAIGGRLVSHPKVYEIVMDVRRCNFSAAKNFIYKNKNEDAVLARCLDTEIRRQTSFKIRAAAVELATKYRLGADPKQCMESLAKFIEETQRG